ncbi:hypothetical protein [Mucilaginibacter kameinonensis]|uniref:hypothetical protein n=1 Tax=Mucilaginibacter kameinonensis TaxID=452286 RepID=UPI000EF7D58C|nr:hypothetical protein [Mucilaginibacter kameinonensis]
MRYLLLIIFAICTKTSACAQSYALTTDDKVKAKLDTFKNENVSRYIVYNVSCSGVHPRLVVDGQCTVYDIKYVVWLENGKSYLQRFDECNEYKAKLIDQEFFNTVSKGIAEIKIARILSPQIKVMNNGKLVLMNVIRDHTCVSIFKIYWGSEFIEKHVDQFNLSFKYSDEKQLNMHYRHNQNSILNKLYKQIHSAIIGAGYVSK